MSDFILFKEHQKSDSTFLLEIQLNNPSKLNALSLEMIQKLNQEIKKWRDREELSAVFIHSAGDRAFCAGGDVAWLYSQIKASREKGLDLALSAKDFFHTEYETDYMLSQFPKPIVLWGSGIVMGGGMGLFMSSSHPVATESSLFAMPEVSIGFFPDVGASYFLNNIPHRLGLYLALTACRLNARAAQFLNLTPWFFYNKDKQRMFDFLKGASFKNKADFDIQFKDFYKEPDFLSVQECWIENFKTEILKALEFKNLDSFYDYFSQVHLEDKQWEQNRQNFLKASPSSLAVVFEQFKRARRQTDRKALFEMESVIAMNMSCRSDFPEGVRALLVDKTKDPKWSPNHIDNIDPEEIDKYFIPQEGWSCALKV
ncbi:MAG: enoyl-CoA hydratase/isomerase family protein [Oligoflexia bacterium]|nr:enoyl-CoA hydratase/isomerase family protein [Oligoflexia bacterium]